MKKKNKVLLIILAGILVGLAVAGLFFYLFNRHGKDNVSSIEINSNTENFVDFRDGVQVTDDFKKIKKNFIEVDVDDSVYTLVYKKSLPEFFNNMEAGEIFCVYPDSGAKESFFALGFCGQITSKGETDEGYTVSFTMPQLTDVFSDIYINTQGTDNGGEISTAFYPSENVTEMNLGKQELLCAAASPSILAAVGQDEPSTLKDSFGYKYKEPKTTSLLEDYILVCEEMDMKFDCNLTDEDGFGLGVKGNVTLEDMAVKMLLDYHYDETSDTVSINDYSLGVITKQKVDMDFSANQSVGLDDLDFDLTDSIKIIDIEDVTESEKGKIVLGTYLIGLEASLPILENSTNKVSYLSLGIAVQLAVSASGELSLEYSVEESGFAQIEVNGNGENTYLVKGYDYPNPVVDSRQPTEEEIASIPEVESEIKGKASFDMTVGADVGLCILGMIPVKLTNNFIEFEVTRSFDDQIEEKATELISNNYLLDDSVDYLMLSSNSFLKMHLGAQINFGVLKYKVAEMGGSVQLFKNVWYQVPSPIGFSHSQCGFGGVYVGEVYTDEELAQAYKDYLEDTDQNGIINTAKEVAYGSFINAIFEKLNLDLMDLSSYLGEEIDNYKITYYAAGVFYVRDQSNKVIAALVTGEDVGNEAGVHNGLSKGKIEQLYSASDFMTDFNFSIGSFARSLLDIDVVDDIEMLECSYYSKDSSEKLDLVFCNDELKIIIVTSGGGE